MAISQVSICNSALVKLGAEPISSLSQSTKSAKSLAAIYDQVRDEVLRAHPWHFATKRVILVPNATVPAFGYDFSFDLPNDYLRIVDDEDPDTDYVIENGQILSNMDNLNIRYVYRNAAEDQWDACFAEAFSCRLAREVCYALTQSATLVQGMDSLYKAALQSARTMNGSEGIIKNLVVDEWSNARK